MISVMVVGGPRLVRDALAAVLSGAGHLVVAAVHPLPEEVLAAAAAHRPAVIVVDLSTAPADPAGAAAERLVLVRRLSRELAECRVLVVTGSPHPVLLRRVLAAGAWGLLRADATPDQLAVAVAQLAGGERVLAPDLAAALLGPGDSPLTGQERAVLRLVRAGLGSREIAQRLYLAPGTVRNHLSRAIRKTGTRNRWEAVRRADQAGWLWEPEPGP